jgi:hypothetical protein
VFLPTPLGPLIAIFVLGKLLTIGCPQAPFGVRFFLFPPDGRRILAAFNETKKWAASLPPSLWREGRREILL